MGKSSGYYPIMLNISGRTCIVIGGGSVAARKLKELLFCGAKVKLFSSMINPSIKEMILTKKNLEWIERDYEHGDLEGAYLVIGATDNSYINEAVYKEAKERGIPVNIADNPGYCNFIAPSVLRRGKLQICVSTGGECPDIAKKIREKLEEEFDESYGGLVEIVGEVRRFIICEINDEKSKKILLKKLSGKYMEILSLIRRGIGRGMIKQDLILNFCTKLNNAK